MADFDASDIVKPPLEVEIPQSLIEMPLNQVEEVRDDEICQALKEENVPDQILKAVLMGFAEEQSSLKNLRQKKAKENKDTSFISLKRGTLLKYMSEALLQRQALSGSFSGGDLDLRGPKFREVFKMLLGIINDTFDSVKIPSEYKEMFFHALKTNLDGWEERAEKIIKTMNLPNNMGNTSK